MLPSAWTNETISRTHLESVLDSYPGVDSFQYDRNNKLVNMGHVLVIHNIIHVLQTRHCIFPPIWRILFPAIPGEERVHTYDKCVTSQKSYCIVVIG